MTEALLQDLTEYKRNKKDKTVVAAAKSLISTFREMNPELLRRKDRGKPSDDPEKDARPSAFGEVRVAAFVPGTELLSLAEDRDAAAQAREGTVEESANSGSDGEVEGEDDQPADPFSPEDRQRRAVALSSLRPLTEDDFRRIRELRQERTHLPALAGSKRARREAQADDESDEDSEPDTAGRIDPTEILPTAYRQRQDKAARLASILEGREERGSFGARKGHDGGTTNRQKEKHKNPIMLKRKLEGRRAMKARKNTVRQCTPPSPAACPARSLLPAPTDDEEPEEAVPRPHEEEEVTERRASSSRPR